MNHEVILWITIACTGIGFLWMLLATKDPDIQDWIDKHFDHLFDGPYKTITYQWPPKKQITTIPNKYYHSEIELQELTPGPHFVWSEIANTWTTPEEYEYFKSKYSLFSRGLITPEEALKQLEENK